MTGVRPSPAEPEGREIGSGIPAESGHLGSGWPDGHEVIVGDGANIRRGESHKRLSPPRRSHELDNDCTWTRGIHYRPEVTTAQTMRR